MGFGKKGPREDADNIGFVGRGTNGMRTEEGGG